MNYKILCAMLIFCITHVYAVDTNLKTAMVFRQQPYFTVGKEIFFQTDVTKAFDQCLTNCLNILKKDSMYFDNIDTITIYTQSSQYRKIIFEKYKNSFLKKQNTALKVIIEHNPPMDVVMCMTMHATKKIGLQK